MKSVYVLDDSGAYGVGIANSFQSQAEKKGIKVLGRDRLDPKAADYTAILTKIKSLNPDALYYGGVLQAGVKLAKQSYDIIPKVIKAGGDGMDGPEMLTAAGFPAAEGWYATNASPHMTDDTKAAEFVKHYKAKFSVAPDDYSITAYDGGLVIVDAVKTWWRSTSRSTTTRCVTPFRRPARRRSRVWSRSMTMGTSRTVPSASSRSGRTHPSRWTISPPSITTSAWRRRADTATMTFSDLLLQQTINGLSLGGMYALLALGFTLIYGILELINFAHFNVFMVGSFVALWTLQSFGLSGQDVVLTGLPLLGVLLAAFIVTMGFSGLLGVAIERLSLRPLRNVTGPAAMITTIGVSYILFNVVLLTVGADSKNFPNPLPPMKYRNPRRCRGVA